MLKHVVFLSFKSALSTIEIKNILQAVGDLRSVIPDIISFEMIDNVSKEGLDQGYGYGVVLGFQNEQARDAYLFHPEHVRVAQEQVFPMLLNGKNSIVVFDYFEQETSVKSVAVVF